MDLLDDDQRRRLLTYHRDGRQWLEELPGLVGELTRRWKLDLGTTLRPGGDASWTGRVTRTDGEPAVLKVALPDPQGEAAAAVLRLLDGRGAVRLLEHDSEHHAFLLEWGDPGTFAAAMPLAEADDAAVAVLPPLWALSPSSLPDLPRSADVAQQRAHQLRQRAERLEDPLLGAGADLFASLATEAVRPRVLHGDANQRNVLRSARGWLVIDPRPMLGEPCFELAAWVTTRLDEVADPVRRVTALADRLALPPDRALAWVAAQTLMLCSWLQHSGEPGPLETYRGAARRLLAALG